MRKHLRISGGAKAVASILQPAAQLDEVIDLTVQHGRGGPELIRDGRISGTEIDDRETVLRDNCGRTPETSRGVRSPMVLNRQLGVDDLFEIRAVGADDARDAAHHKPRGALVSS